MHACMVIVCLSHIYVICFMILNSNCEYMNSTTTYTIQHGFSGRKAMFVANHNSWMDIPFLGHTIGWHNYKFVAKKELEKVPILGKAIKVAKNVLVDR